MIRIVRDDFTDRDITDMEFSDPEWSESQFAQSLGIPGAVAVIGDDHFVLGIEIERSLQLLRAKIDDSDECADLRDEVRRQFDQISTTVDLAESESDRYVLSLVDMGFELFAAGPTAGFACPARLVLKS